METVRFLDTPSKGMPNRQSAEIKPASPERLLTLSAVCRRGGIAKSALVGAVRRGIAVPDFVTDAGHKLFRPERLGQVILSIRQNPSK